MKPIGYGLPYDPMKVLTPEQAAENLRVLKAKISAGLFKRVDYGDGGGIMVEQPVWLDETACERESQS